MTPPETKPDGESPRPKRRSTPGRRRPANRPWQLVQVESAIACNLGCVMCPWRQAAGRASHGGLMGREVWQAIARRLDRIASVDFTGGGEPLLNPRLAGWVGQAARAGCRTGVLTNGTLLSAGMSSRLLDAGIDWVCVSIDGATADVYEAIRPGADFRRVCRNLAHLAARRPARGPFLMINFVLLAANVHQVVDMVRLARELGVDQVNFKHCDVIRAENGRHLGLFADHTTRRIRKMEKQLRKARRLARRLHIRTTAFAWTPDEQPVCPQDPRTSLFVRHDGAVAPCINLSRGGPTTFLNRPAEMPTLHYGRIPAQDLERLWQTPECRLFRRRFARRVTSYRTAFALSDLEPSATKLREALENALRAMPPAPEGCRVCHYLYNI